MREPLVSVIMPVYNAQDYIRPAVESVLAQTYKNLEIICVNDCSKDNSLQVLGEIALEDSRVKVIDSPVNVGAGQARNLALEQAQGEYITFVDADDAIEPDLYERVIAKFAETDADQVVWGLVEEHYNDADELIRTVPVVSGEAFLTEKDDITDTILGLEDNSLFGYQWNSVYRASIIRDNGIRFEKALFYEDYFFNLEFAKHMNSLAVLEYAGYHYFKRVNSSITHRFTKDYFDLSYRRIETMFRFCRERDYNDKKLYDVLGNRLLRYTFSALSRNHNPLSEMTVPDMKKWTRESISLDMFRELLPECEASNPAHKVLQLLIAKKCTGLMVLIGKLVYILKK